MKTLSREEALQLLEQGGAIAQILGSASAEGRATIAWVTLRPGRSGRGVELRIHLAVDPGGDAPADPETFRWTSSEPDLCPEGVVTSWLLLEPALERARVEFRALDDDWIELAALSEAYAGFASRGRPPRPHAVFWQRRDPAPDWEAARERMEPHVFGALWSGLEVSVEEARDWTECILESVVRPDIEKFLKARTR